MIEESINDINNYEDVVSVLNRHPELKTIKDIKNNWMPLYTKFNNLKRTGKIDKDLRLPLPWKKRSADNYHFYGDELNTLEKCQEYVDQKGYSSKADFLKSGDPAIYKMDREGFTKDIKFPDKIKEYNTKNYDTIEKCQSFIDNHEDITMVSDLMKSNDDEYHSVYLSIKEHKWFNEIKFSNKNLGRLNLTYLSSLEDIQSFVNSHDDIKCETDFLTNYKNEYKKAVSLGVCSDIEYKFRNRRLRDYTKYNSVSEIQELVNTKGYLTAEEFHKNEHNAWVQYGELKHRENKTLIFKISSGSSNEDKFISVLEMYGIQYMTQLYFPEFIKNNGYYRYDFYLPEKNVIIEVHGEQHFGIDPNEFSPIYNVVEEQKNDEIKYNYAVNEKHIPVYYITYCQDRYESFGYFQPVYTDAIKLLNDIGYTDLTEIDDFCSEENMVKEIQKFIDSFNVKTFEDLNELNYIFGARVLSYNLLNKINFKE